MSAQTVPASPSAPEPSSRLLILTAIALVSVLAPMNSTMVAVGLPAIREHFAVGVGGLTALVVGYLIMVAILQPVAGKLGDALGHLRIIIVGLLLLMVFSAAAAAAWSFPALVLFRALQGVAAACTMANGVAFVRKKVPEHKLSASLGIVGASFAVGAASGPVIGAGLVILGGWRWLFLMNVPVALMALFLITRLPQDAGEGRKTLQIDGWSFVALTGAFTGLALPGITARAGVPVLGLLALGLFPLSAGLYWLRYRAKGTGIVDLRLFTRRAFTAGAVSTSSSNLVMYTLIIGMPLYLGDVRDASTATIGVVLLCQSVAMVVISPVMGALADRIGAGPMLLGGAGLLLANQLALVAVFDDPPFVLLGVSLLVFGVGLGTLSPAMQSIALKAWPPDISGAASGTMNMSRYVGSVTGMAITAAILGANPDEAAFRLLFLAVSAFAVVTLGAAIVMRNGEKAGGSSAAT
jgi:MFS family permease